MSTSDTQNFFERPLWYHSVMSDNSNISRAEKAKRLAIVEDVINKKLKQTGTTLQKEMDVSAQKWANWKNPHNIRGGSVDDVTMKKLHRMFGVDPNYFILGLVDGLPQSIRSEVVKAECGNVTVPRPRGRPAKSAVN
jgi:hypothetical protein